MRCCEDIIASIAYWLLIISTIPIIFYCFHSMIYRWQELDSPLALASGFNFISLVISLGFIALIGAVNKHNNKE